MFSTLFFFMIYTLFIIPFETSPKHSFWMHQSFHVPTKIAVHIICPWRSRTTRIHLVSNQDCTVWVDCFRHPIYPVKIITGTLLCNTLYANFVSTFWPLKMPATHVAFTDNENGFLASNVDFCHRGSGSCSYVCWHYQLIQRWSDWKKTQCCWIVEDHYRNHLQIIHDVDESRSGGTRGYYNIKMKWLY